MMTKNQRPIRKKQDKESVDYDALGHSKILDDFDAHENSLNKLLMLADALEERGLFEPIIGILEDEKTFTKIMILATSDDILKVVQNAKSIVNLLSTLNYDALTGLAQTADSEKQVFAGVASLMRLLNVLESRGIIEPLVGLLNDEQAFSKLAKLVSSDESLSLLVSMQNLARIASSFDSEFADVLSKSVSALKKDVKPVKGLFGVIRQLGDPAVAAGMGKVFEILRVLGEDALSKKGQSNA
jgi:uncharacterized protein YjgD (DUF1641 family)